MKISFVIPAYNEEAYLGKCLDSITKESRGKEHDVEIIVVNNASTDDTRAVALRYPNVTIVDEHRKGIVFARQAGFAASHGELIANVDADTMITPGWIDTALAEFKKNPRLVTLSGPFIYYDLPKSEQFLVKVFYGITYCAYLVNRFVFRVGSVVQGGNFIVRRERAPGDRRVRHEHRVLRRGYRHRKAHAQGGRRQIHLRAADLFVRPPPRKGRHPSRWAPATQSTISG
jgi:glycosyltransferase involved in cell wall biosynthesis